jgi:hypothetical protein
MEKAFKILSCKDPHSIYEKENNEKFGAHNSILRKKSIRIKVSEKLPDLSGAGTGKEINVLEYSGWILFIPRR